MQDSANAAVIPATSSEVVRFWFEQSEPRRWFSKDPAFDGQVRERFIAPVTSASCRALPWQEWPMEW